MTFSMTRTVTETFTLANAKHLASKVTSDMLRCSQNYGEPTQIQINNYGTELAILLRDGYVKEYEFGFSRGNQRVLSWKYTVGATGQLTDDRPGRIVSGIDVSGATFFNFLTRSESWWQLSDAERTAYSRALPIARTVGSGPMDGAGYWERDLSYSSGGVAMPRSTFRPI